MPNSLPFAIPAYYTPVSCPPTRPGWHLCRLACGRYAHLAWCDGSFWDGSQKVENVAYWVELPEFVQEVLTVPLVHVQVVD